MDSGQNTFEADIDQLFDKARRNGSSDYLYTLVRIDGIQCFDGYEDDFLRLRRDLNDVSLSHTREQYRRLAALPGPVKLLLNLLNCVDGKPYDVSPLRAVLKTHTPYSTSPAGADTVAFVATNLRLAKLNSLTERFEQSYRPELITSEITSAEAVEEAFGALYDFLNGIQRRYFEELALAAKGPKYLKVPGSLDVLELITDQEMGGLSGLRVHFSQGCVAEFYRTTKGVFGLNLLFGPPITFLMMSADAGSNEYRVSGKRLYEIGLPGRYNTLGEWKPLIYPGDPSHLIQECMDLSDDPDVQGVLMYLRLTGHRCIEFALRSNMEMPGDLSGTENDELWIWKCPVAGDSSHANVRTYDGWLALQSGEVEEIEQGLQSINSLVSLMFFPYGATYSWRNKYRVVIGGGSLLKPTHEDLKTVDRLLKKFPHGADGYVLAGGIDWYNMGNAATNPFTSFLCYYIAFESVAVAMYDGAELGVFQPRRIAKSERRARSIACIQDKHAVMFGDDPIQFIEEAYFECVKGLKVKTKSVATSVFGENHPYLQALFVKSPETKVSLSDLRSELAHGGKTLLIKEHEEIVRHSVHQMGSITREFLMRVLFRLRPDESVPSWSQEFQMGMSTADPRTTMWATSDKIFPSGTIWKIRPEWCE